MRISDWSSDVCSSDLALAGGVTGHGGQDCREAGGPQERVRRGQFGAAGTAVGGVGDAGLGDDRGHRIALAGVRHDDAGDLVLHELVGAVRGGGSVLLALADLQRSEEHTSELQSLMRTSYA